MKRDAMNLETLRGMNIAVLQGGDSPERDISLLSGAAVLRALRELGAAAYPVDPLDADWAAGLTGAQLAFIALHGAGGEDGAMQGFLQTRGIPYTGSGVLACALTMDKLVAKQLWHGMGLPTAPWEELRAGSDWRGALERLGGRAFVKPACGGSSIASAAAASAAELEAAWRAAAAHGRVLAEGLLAGPEYTVSLLGGEALPAIRVAPGNSFYDYDAKYRSDKTQYHCPCGLAAEAEAELAETARRAFAAARCSVWGRADFMRGADDVFYLLEVNTVPGMTSHSLVPMAAAAVGIGFNELVGRIACLSLDAAIEAVPAKLEAQA